MIDFKNISRFFRREEGATVVEFVILLPVMMVVFAAIVESSRIYWNYQSVVSGVRDATRLLARTTNSDVCGASTAGGNLSSTDARTTIEATMRDEASLFPSGVTVPTVTATYLCLNTPLLRDSITPVVNVTATVNIQLPFGEVFNFFGARSNSVMTSSITDRSRIYGI